jgi:hypothetical protein
MINDKFIHSNPEKGRCPIGTLRPGTLESFFAVALEKKQSCEILVRLCEIY